MISHKVVVDLFSTPEQFPIRFGNNRFEKWVKCGMRNEQREDPNIVHFLVCVQSY